MTNTSRAMLALATLTTVASTGCQPQWIESARNTDVTRVSRADLATDDFVPPGAQYSAILDRAIDTGYSLPGDRFTAHVVTPIVAANGRVVVRSGAQLWGHVMRIDPPARAPGALLAFDVIETEGGFVPVQLRVMATRPLVYTSPARVPLPPSGPRFSVAWYGVRPGMFYSNALDEVAGSYVPPEYFGHPREGSWLPRSRLQLQVRSPIIPPGVAAPIRK